MSEFWFLENYSASMLVSSMRTNNLLDLLRVWLDKSADGKVESRHGGLSRGAVYLLRRDTWVSHTRRFYY
jgi:hypothetical protein